MEQINLKNRKKMKNLLFVAFGVFLLLAIRIGVIQFINGNELKKMAYEQQIQQRSINPKRGTIYDLTGKYILAESSTAYTVTVNPTNILSEDKEKVAKKLTELFNLDYETVIKKVKKISSIETIVKKIDKEQADILRKWLIENNINTGINID